MLLNLPLSKETAMSVESGRQYTLSGEILLARDAAHKRLCEMIDRGERLPVDLKDAVIYYCGPAATPPGYVIGSAGPTTSSRMDAYAPALLEQGVIAMIGKGQRSQSVIKAIEKHGAVYFAAVGGAGALLARKFVSIEIAAFPDLGPEAIRRAVVRDFPVTAAIDARGTSAYK